MTTRRGPEHGPLADPAEFDYWANSDPGPYSPGAPPTASAPLPAAAASARPPRHAPSNLELLEQQEREAVERMSDLIVRLEAAADKCEATRDAYYRESAARDALVWEAHEAGLSQVFIAEVSGLGHQPHVVRAKARHADRMGEKERKG